MHNYCPAEASDHAIPMRRETEGSGFLASLSDTNRAEELMAAVGIPCGESMVATLSSSCDSQQQDVLSELHLARDCMGEILEQGGRLRRLMQNRGGCIWLKSYRIHAVGSSQEGANEHLRGGRGYES